MAKEERIYILKVSVCEGGREKDWEDCGCFIDDTGFCKYHPKCKHSLTRAEAINKIAKAICHHPYPSCEGCIVEKKKKACKQAFEGMKELAEVALDALLEAKK